MYAQPEHAPIVWFVMQRAVDSFRAIYGRYPCSNIHEQVWISLFRVFSSRRVYLCAMYLQDNDAQLLLNEAASLLGTYDIAEPVWRPSLSAKHAIEM